MKCCFDLIKSGYTPKIKFQGGRFTDIFCEFNKINVRLQTQHLIKGEFDGVVCVNDLCAVTLLEESTSESLLEQKPSE